MDGSDCLFDRDFDWEDSRASAMKTRIVRQSMDCVYGRSAEHDIVS